MIPTSAGSIPLGSPWVQHHEMSPGTGVPHQARSPSKGFTMSKSEYTYTRRR